MAERENFIASLRPTVPIVVAYHTSVHHLCFPTSYQHTNKIAERHFTRQD